MVFQMVVIGGAWAVWYCGWEVPRMLLMNFT